MPARTAAGLARRRLAVLALLVAAVTAGCGPGAGAMTVSGAWIRAAPSVDAPSAAYLTVANGTGQADALLRASSPVAARVELHQTSMASGGMAGMTPMDRLEIPAGATVRLEPGAGHLMVSGLSRPLAAGETVELDLVFEHAGTIVVQADVTAG